MGRGFSEVHIRQHRSFWLLIVIAVGGAIVYYLSGTATVTLENDSQGSAVFYVDGNVACHAAPGMHCDVRLRVWKSHSLSASTTYANAATVQTPAVTLAVRRRDAYTYLACGLTGTAGQNCGLFNKNPTPATY